MKIVIITQNDPFYLADNLKYLIQILPKHSEIIGCVVNDVSPFGKKETFIQKAKKTYNIFGWNFFLHYAIKFISNKFNSKKNVRKLLKDNSIKEIVLEKHINHEDSIKKIKQFKPDLLLSILGNQIFKKQIIELAPKGCLNLHTALLPKYRGLMPSFWVLKNNEKYTGASVFFVDKGIDSGPIIVQKKIEIKSRNLEELIIHTKRVGMEAITEAINLIENDNLQLIENDSQKMTYFSFPTKEDVNVFLKNGKRFY
tara:strand:+ start:594 stop:1358 length:765 start_codon:yes stop_codon:yes gene_type:complete